MPGDLRVESYAIISADGMLADRNRHMPQSLHIDADQRFFTRALDRAALVVHGRHSHEHKPDSDARRRVVLTHTIASIERHPSLPNALLWNPAGASFAQACSASGVSSGLVAVSGGAGVFDYFLRRGLDAFHLSTVATVLLPGGHAVLPGVPERAPEQILAEHGLVPGPVQVLDERAGATLVTWRPRNT